MTLLKETNIESAKKCLQGSRHASLCCGTNNINSVFQGQYPQRKSKIPFPSQNPSSPAAKRQFRRPPPGKSFHKISLYLIIKSAQQCNPTFHPMSRIVLGVQSDRHDVIGRMSGGRKSSLSFACLIDGTRVDFLLNKICRSARFDPHDRQYVVQYLRNKEIDFYF